MLTELLVTMFNHWELISGDVPAALASGFMSGAPSAYQTHAFTQLFEEVAGIVRLSPVVSMGLGRATKSLHSIIDKIGSILNAHIPRRLMKRLSLSFLCQRSQFEL